MTIEAQEFKTKVRGKDDFFSWQLYRWLKKYPDRTRIYRSHAYFGKLVDPTLHIGVIDSEGWFYGNDLRRICHTGRRIECFAYPPVVHRVHEFEDVTDWFWNEYRRIGVCAIHEGFWHKWVMDGADSRTCEYCGKSERRTLEKVTKTIEVWT